MPTRGRAAIAILVAAAIVSTCASPSAMQSEPQSSVPATAVGLPSLPPTPSTPPQTSLPTATATVPSVTPSPIPSSTAQPTPAATLDIGEWQGPIRVSDRQCVRPRRSCGSASLALDTEGSAHAAVEADGAIVYLTNSGGSWSEEVLARPAGGSVGVWNGDPSIAVDSSGRVWIAFEQRLVANFEGAITGGPTLLYVTNVSGTWSEPIHVADDSEGVLFGEREGRLQLVLYNNEDGTSRYVSGSAGDWSSWSTPAGTWIVGWDMAPDGGAYIAYRDDSQCHAAVFRSADAREPSVEAWAGGPTPQPCPAGLGLVESSRDVLAVDAAGEPHFVVEIDSKPHYVSRNHGAWADPLPIFEQPIGAADVAVDETFNFHVASADVGTGDGLLYAQYAGGGFQSLKLSDTAAWDYEWGPPQLPALAVGPDGRPHVLFALDRGTLGLWYAVGPEDQEGE